MRRKTLTLGFGVALGSVLCGTVAYVQARTTASWQQVRAWAQAEQARQEALPRYRQALGGEPTAGSAWEAYARARLCSDAHYQADEELLRLWRLRPDEVSVKERLGLLQRWSQALAAMREGARRTDARHPTEWSSGLGHRTSNLLSARCLVNVAVLDAKQTLAEGRGLDAIGLLLDAATYGADHVASPILIDQMVGCSLVAIATAEAWTDAELAALDHEALQALAAGLERLDALLPTHARFQAEALLFANQILRPRTLPLWKKDERLAGLWWRYAFSTAWAVADTVLLEVGAFERLAASESDPWPARELHYDRELRSRAVLDNPLLAMMLGNLGSAERTLRTTTAAVRLLRCAVELRLRRGVRPLPDPLGEGELVAELHDDYVVLTCAEPGRNKLLRRTVALD